MEGPLSLAWQSAKATPIPFWVLASNFPSFSFLDSPLLGLCFQVTSGALRLCPAPTLCQFSQGTVVPSPLYVLLSPFTAI